MTEENAGKNETKQTDQSTSEQVEQVTPPQPELSEVDHLRQKLEEVEKNAEFFKDQLLRKAAEFENYKRRFEADYINLIKNANEGLITSLIPILNDLVRSLRSGKEQRDYDALYRGIELIHNKFVKILEAQGLVPFESTGKPFDVEYHDALLQVPRDDVPPHTVIEEVERGYKLNNKVLSHAKVIVSTAPANEQNQQGESKQDTTGNGKD